MYEPEFLPQPLPLGTDFSKEHTVGRSAGDAYGIMADEDSDPLGRGKRLCDERVVGLPGRGPSPASSPSPP